MITVSISGHDALAKRLVEMGADAPKAATRAINRTLITVRAETARALAANLRLAVGIVKQHLPITRATWTRQIGKMDVSAKRIPLINFAARQVAGGVSYSLSGGGRGFVPGGFIRTVRSTSQIEMGVSGHRGVFARRLPSIRRSVGAWSLNLPIVEQRGPSLARDFVRSGEFQTQETRAGEIFERNLTHEIDRILQQRAEGSDGSEGA